jgi:hypothetical protein
MEVPCCSNLLGIVQKAKEIAEAEIEIKNIVLSLYGQVKFEQDIA